MKGQSTTYYEVIISGAGPAGSIAALCLARQGHKVLLVDSTVFPREKVCGDLLVMAGLELLRKFGIYNDVITKDAYPINQVHLIGPYNTTLPIQVMFKSKQTEMVGFKRMLFDQKLVQLAEKSGAQRCIGRVCGLEYQDNRIRVRIRTRNGYCTYNTRAMIGADGVSSFVARTTGGIPWKHRAIAIRGYLTGMTLQPHMLEVHFPAMLWPGYAWLFPVGSGKVNVGLGMDINAYRRKKHDLRVLLQRFIMSHRIKNRRGKESKLQQVRTWPLNLGPPRWSRLVRDRCLLAGDAAGLTNAMTGGGIINAMYSGKLAAEVLSEKLSQDALSKNDLTIYSKRVRKLLSKELWLSHKISQVVALSPHIAEHIIKGAHRTGWFYNVMNIIYSDVQIDRTNSDNDEIVKIVVRNIAN